jgi:hypothetical protein
MCFFINKKTILDQIDILIWNLLLLSQNIVWVTFQINRYKKLLVFDCYCLYETSMWGNHSRQKCQRQMSWKACHLKWLHYKEWLSKEMLSVGIYVGSMSHGSSLLDPIRQLTFYCNIQILKAVPQSFFFCEKKSYCPLHQQEMQSFLKI